MDNNWSLVYTIDKLYKAEILKEILADNGIESFVANKLDSSFIIGEVEIYVMPDDVMKAKHLIEKFEN